LAVVMMIVEPDQGVGGQRGGRVEPAADQEGEGAQNVVVHKWSTGRLGVDQCA
jgi:hypothetical protein